MPPKGAKPTSDELLAQFDDLGVERNDSAGKESKPNQETKPTTSTPGQQDQDIFAELDNLASQHPSSRSGTPRLSTEPRSSTRPLKPPTTATPSTGRSSEDKSAPRKSQESGRSSRIDNKSGDAQPSDSEKPAPQGGGWFGGLFATASAAMKQAEAAVKEIQNNEEAQKWAEQMKGNVGALRDLGISTTPDTSTLGHANHQVVKAASFEVGPSQPSPPLSTHLRRRFRPTSVFRSTLPTISRATPSLTP